MAAAPEDASQPVYLEGFGSSAKVRIRVLSPIVEKDTQGKSRLRWFRDKPIGGSLDKGKTKNGNSVVLKLEYKNISILLGGDLNSSAEAQLLKHYTQLPWPPEDSAAETILIDAAKRVFQADIAKCCHHGSADFTDTFMKSVNSGATVISSGDEESHAHPRSDTLGAIGLHGRGWRPLIFSTELARSTREDEGNKRVELGKILEKIEAATDPEIIAALKKDRDDKLDDLAKRNVTVYGSINLRTDGHSVLFAYKRELPKVGKSGGKITLNKWDKYVMQRPGDGPLVYVGG